MEVHEFIDRVGKALDDASAHGFGPNEDAAFLNLPADLALRLQNQQAGLIVKRPTDGVVSVSDPSGRHTVTLVFQVNAGELTAGAKQVIQREGG